MHLGDAYMRGVVGALLAKVVGSSVLRAGGPVLEASVEMANFGSAP